jgi:uncharacterized membrane protein YhaH (DUF805 family)
LEAPITETATYALHAHSDWFSLSVKRQRLNYFFATILLAMYSFAILLMLTWMLGDLSFILAGALGFLYFGMEMLLASQRLRDIEVSQWWLAPVFAAQSITVAQSTPLYFMILPLISVGFLIFWPGRDQTSRDRTSDRQANKSSINESRKSKSVLIIVTLFVMGVLFWSVSFIEDTRYDLCLERLEQSRTLYLDPDAICKEEAKLFSLSQ